MSGDIKESAISVIPAQAGIQIATLDSRLRGNDKETQVSVMKRYQGHDQLIV